MPEDLIGKRFNDLLVERFIRYSKSYGAIFEARCLRLKAGRECGNLRKASRQHLQRGEVKACSECGQESRRRACNRWYAQTFYAR